MRAEVRGRRKVRAKVPVSKELGYLRTYPRLSVGSFIRAALFKRNSAVRLLETYVSVSTQCESLLSCMYVVLSNSCSTPDHNNLQ